MKVCCQRLGRVERNRIVDKPSPSPPYRVQWRLGAVDQERNRYLALAYVDARDVQNPIAGVVFAAVLATLQTYRH